MNGYDVMTRIQSIMTAQHDTSIRRWGYLARFGLRFGIDSALFCIHVTD